MSDLVVISNGAAEAAVSSLGAELKNWRIGGQEYIWQNQQNLWRGSAPVLFPIVGGLNGGVYRLAGREYAMPKHGIVRRREFSPSIRSAERAVFTTTSDAQTREIYPFDFTLSLEFSLATTGELRVNSSVRNNGAMEMPFSFGSHPAFNLPFAGGDFADYSVVFNRPEELKRWGLLEGLLSPAPTGDYGTGTEIRLRRDIFDEGALIFKKIRSDEVALLHRPSGRRIVMHTGGTPDIGIWAMPGADYVCLEPWYGYDDPHGFAGDFRDKPGVMLLPAGEEFVTTYRLWVE